MSPRAAALHPDHAREQAYIEKVDEAVQHQRRRAGRAAESGGDRVAARTIRKHMLERLAEPVDNDSLCFGRIDLKSGKTYYLGRKAVHGEHSELLVVNWRMPVVAGFYTANRKDPEDLELRRRFELDQLRLLGIVDETFGARAKVRPAHTKDVAPRKPAAAPESHAPSEPRVEPESDQRPAPEPRAKPEIPPEPDVLPEPDGLPEPEGEEDEGAEEAVVADVEPQAIDAILADMERARGTEMRDIVATIEAKQYELISDSIDGILVIQGGPGTGKTAIALHRAAWLLFNHRQELERSGVLVVGPNRAFMEYVAKVLPSLGETSVTQLPIERLPDLDEVRLRGADSAEVARLKGDVRMARVVQRAVFARVRLPDGDVEVLVGRWPVALSAADITSLIEEAWQSGTYTQARDVFRRTLVGLAQRRAGAGRGLFRSGPSAAEIQTAVTAAGGPLDRIWPTATAPEVIRDLLNSRQRLDAAAELLTEEERAMLQRDRARLLREEPWTGAEVALLDEADAALRGVTSFGYVLADEAQDLSPMQLRMVLRRSIRGRATLVGDIVQATGPQRFADWTDLFEAAAVDIEPRIAELAIGYRVPQQIMELAGELVPRIAPEVFVPRAVRLGPEAPRLRSLWQRDLAKVLVAEVSSLAGGERSIGVVAPAADLGRVRAVLAEAGLQAGDVLIDGLARSVTVLSADQAKGLEFDHMVVVEPAAIAGQEEDWALVYIALTRATRTLCVLYSTPEPFEVPPQEQAPEPEAGTGRLVLADVPTVNSAENGTQLTGRYTEALIHAKFVHAGHRRRGTSAPYLAHLQAVAALVLEDGGTEDEAIAALMHDAVEAHGPEVLGDIVDRFGMNVARIVVGCSVTADDPSTSWRARKVAHLHALESAGPEVRRVVLAEGVDNARALLRDYRRLGPRLWTNMQVDPEDLLWYRSALADLFVTERPGDMASEFQETVDKLLDLASRPEGGGEDLGLGQSRETTSPAATSR